MCVCLNVYETWVSVAFGWLLASLYVELKGLQNRMSQVKSDPSTLGGDGNAMILQTCMNH